MSKKETETVAHFVLIVHGIRTEGVWVEPMCSAIEQSSEACRAIPIGYGYFDLFRFVFPGPWRNRPAATLAREIIELRIRNPNSRVSVIAHSFGTYSVVRALRDHPSIQLFRLYLCGSILPRDYPWNQIRNRVQDSILNDCGTLDVWPVIAASISSSYGPSGAFGFRTQHVKDRFHRVGHSGFMNEGFAKKYVVPFVITGADTLPRGRAGRRPTPPWWQSALSLVRVRWLALAAVLLLALPQIPSLISDKITEATPPTKVLEDWREVLSSAADTSAKEEQVSKVARYYLSRARGNPINAYKEREALSSIGGLLFTRNEPIIWAESDYGDVRGLDIWYSNLANADLSEYDFTGSNFMGSDLSNADLSQASLARATVRSANFSGVTFFETDMKDVDWFNSVGLTVAQLQGMMNVMDCPSSVEEMISFHDSHYAIVKFEGLGLSDQRGFRRQWRQFIEAGMCDAVRTNNAVERSSQ